MPFLIRFLNYMGYDLSGYQASGKFDDDAAISAWAKDAVYLSQALGLVKAWAAMSLIPAPPPPVPLWPVIMDELMDKTDELVQPAKPTPTTKPSGGGGGGGGGSTPPLLLSGIYILRNEVWMSPALPCTPVMSSTPISPQGFGLFHPAGWWAVSQRSPSENVYTVSSLDVGQTVTAEATRHRQLLGTVTSAATGKGGRAGGSGETDPDKSPVVVDEGRQIRQRKRRKRSKSPRMLSSLWMSPSRTEAVGRRVRQDQNCHRNSYPEAEVTPELVTLDVDLSMTTEGRR